MTKLITDEQRAQLLANGRQSLEQDNFDPAPVVRLFTPDAGATWVWAIPSWAGSAWQNLRLCAAGWDLRWNETCTSLRRSG